MGPTDYILLISVFLVFGILLYIPCHWWVRRRSRKIDPDSDFVLRITSSGLALCTLMVTALLLGFSQGHLSPETLFGRFISTWQGKIYYIVVIWLLTVIFGLILQKLGFTLFKRHDKDE